MKWSLAVCLSWAMLFHVSLGFAQDEVRGAKPGVQWGIVREEGALVYQDASFDAVVVAQLKPGQKIRMATVISKAIDGFGTFYRVVYKPKTIGFVSDAEVIPEFKVNSGRTRGKKDNPDFQATEDEIEGRNTVYLTRYMGASFGLMRYTEKFQSGRLSDSVWVAGLKMSGPGTLFDGPPLEFDLLFHAGAPKYYNAMSRSSPTGYLVVPSVSLNLSLHDSMRRMLYWGFGFMVVYARFTFNGITQRAPEIIGKIDSEEVRLGASAHLGFAQRFGKTVLGKVEGKYFYELSPYWSMIGAIQVEY